LIAACYRVHGDAFLPLVARRFASSGTATNLLGDIRCLPPTEPVNDHHEARRTADLVEDTGQVSGFLDAPKPTALHARRRKPHMIFR
jgi:hypothetical protein